MDEHLEHAKGFAAAWSQPSPVPAPPDCCADLGTGGGVPGLVLAVLWPGTRLLLIETGRRRAAFLAGAAKRLGLSSVEVMARRAEDVGRDPATRMTMDLVVARGFGPPPVTAECGAPLLRLGGCLVVSEPPEPPPDRWPAGPLAELGLALHSRVAVPATYAVLQQVSPCPPRYPRRPGVPAKRPLF